MFTHLQQTTFEHFVSDKDNFARARRIAERMFYQARWQGKRTRLWAKLIGKTNGLRGISQHPKASHRIAGTLVVPLAKIVGTEGRSEDFDADFRPMKGHNRERWINIATACQMGIMLPAVELLQDGDEYYVRDGHHRISVARMMGQLEIDARVVN